MNKKDRLNLISIYLEWYSDLKECESRCKWVFIYARMDKLKKAILEDINLFPKEKQKEIKKYLKDGEKTDG